MTQAQEEDMFLDLNSVLVKFWISKGRPEKEVKIKLLRRMLHWYENMGYIIMDEKNNDNMEKTLEDRVAEYVEGVKSINPEVTWDLLHTAVLYGYHMGVEDEQNRPCKGVN